MDKQALWIHTDLVPWNARVDVDGGSAIRLVRRSPLPAKEA